MNRDEVERLRGMVVDQIAGLQEILDALSRELDSPVTSPMTRTMTWVMT